MHQRPGIGYRAFDDERNGEKPFSNCTDRRSRRRKNDGRGLVPPGDRREGSHRARDGDDVVHGWLSQGEGFFESLDTSLERELERYDAVIFFESAAVGNISIEGGNPARTENNEEARELDMRLRELWSKHPSFHFVPHSASFFAKLQNGLGQLQHIIDDNGWLHPDS